MKRYVFVTRFFKVTLKQRDSITNLRYIDYLSVIIIPLKLRNDTLIIGK